MNHLIGTYQLQLPQGTTIRAKHSIPPTKKIGEGHTHWEISLGEFILRIHLNPRGIPSDLAGFILSCTKEYVQLDQIEINGTYGVKFGEYTSPRSWTDWWLKRGDLMICINLQGPARPTSEDIQLHSQILQSLRYVAV